MKFIRRLFCRIRGHVWGRTNRADNPMPDVLAPHGIRRCKRCGEVQTVPMRPLNHRKADQEKPF